ncbi:DUF3853 family protein [Kaistella carnis]|uniref:DUF3853 family protein n=1 Tax=Kaistella carnis TaxID=1241979 RepID=UPI00289C08FF|nr:DUF3853 family protein [Kaistella carnis]MCZ2223077.1 DUF3853 family protein [Chitinophagales bacterium]
MKIENLLEKPIWQMTGQEFLALNEQSRSTVQDQQIVSISENSLNKKYVYGIRGIANLLNCSIAKANRIKKRGIIDEAIIQEGRSIMVDVELALSLIKNNM